MDLEYLKEFVHLADTLSFKQTAEHFFVSRSVISRHLATLEETLGTRLIERGGQTVRLTEIGRIFYRDAQIVLRDYDIAVENVRIAQESQALVVRVGYLRNAARPVIVRFVRYMKENYPNVRLSTTCMEYGELRRALEDGAVDIALAVNVSPAISRNYRMTPIYRDQFFAVMSKDHPLATQTEGIALSDLAKEKLILPDSFVYSGLSELIDSLVEKKSQIIAREYYRDIDMLYLKVQTEDYVAFSSSMNNLMFGDRLAIIPVLGIDSSFSTSAFYRNDFCGSAFEACREAFEECRASLRHPDTGFTLAHFE